MLVNWLNLALGVRKTLDSFATHWPQPVADMRAQLASLFADGFVAAIPDANWSRMAIYLRALQVRLERLQNKPQRDEDLTKQVAPFAAQLPDLSRPARWRSEEHTSELQSLMRISYAVFCLKNTIVHITELLYNIPQ